MLSVQQSLKDCLSQIHDYFEENIKSDFQDQIERRCVNNRQTDLNISPTLGITHNGITELTDLTILKTPNYNVTKFELNMEQMYIEVNLEIPDLSIEGSYSVYSVPGNPEIVEDEGNILFVLQDVVCDGVIPIQVVEDSFVVKHFYLNFKPTGIKTKKSSNKGAKVECSESNESTIDNTLMKYFLANFLEKFFYTIYRDLGGPIVEYSVVELFGDEPQEMIEFSTQRCNLANDLVDSILACVASKRISTVEVPDLNFSHKESQSSTIINFKEGTIENLSNWSRFQHSAIYEIDNIIYVEGMLKMNNFEFKYNKCTASRAGEETSGTVKLTAIRPKIAFKISLGKVEEAYVTKLEFIKHYDLVGVDVDATGLDSISDIRDKVLSWVGAFFEGEVSHTLNKSLEDLFKGVIENFDMAAAVLEK